jgi:signal peptidase II
MRKYNLLVALSLVALFADQWSKYLAIEHLTRLHEHPELGGFMSAKGLMGMATAPVELLPVWEWRYAENTGSAFSFMATASESFRGPFFLLVAVAAIAMIGYFYQQATLEQRWRRVGLAMVLGGALGNSLDRLVHGYVVDFIAWHYGPHYWPTFNVADSFVCVGVGMLLTEGMFTRQASSTTQPVA